MEEYNSDIAYKAGKILNYHGYKIITLADDDSDNTCKNCYFYQSPECRSARCCDNDIYFKKL